MKAVRKWRAIQQNDDPRLMFDRTFTLQCPHCGAMSNPVAVSVPRWEQVTRFFPRKVILGLRCNGCSAPIALRFDVYDEVNSHNCFYLSEEYEVLERAMETFDYQHLPTAVANDFREALTCFSHSCYNATAAMCRRTIQSVANNLGVTGTSRVEKQILEAKEQTEMDEETYSGLKQIMLDGHDGAHPHLPEVTPERAAILIEIMKDVLTQIYVRTQRIKAAMKLREQAVASKRESQARD